MIRGELQVKRQLPGPLKIEAKRPDDAPLFTLDEMVTELKGKTVTNDLPALCTEKMRAYAKGLPKLSMYQPKDLHGGVELRHVHDVPAANILYACDEIDALRSRLKLAEAVCELVGTHITPRDYLTDLETACHHWRSARDAKPKDAE